MLKKLLGLRSYRWDWLQVEVSTRCQAACTYCPTAIFRQEGSNLLMSLETFAQLVPSFAQARLVFLQGWGEPFLNPHFFEMAEIAKTAGCKVGTTTNGMLLDADRLTRLVHSGVDIVAFSLAGCTATNDTVRKGARLAQVLECIRQLARIKDQEGRPRPEIHIAYLLLRSGLDELEQIPALLTGLGVSQVVISTLDFVPLPRLAPEAIIPASQAEYDNLRGRLDKLAAEGRRVGLDIRAQLVGPQAIQQEADLSADDPFDLAALLAMTRPACTENIQKAAFIAANGDVSPCVFTHLPLRSPEAAAKRIGWSCQPLIFGNIHDCSLDAIWQSPAYREFRRAHRARDLEDPCKSCLKTRVISG